MFLKVEVVIVFVEVKLNVKVIIIFLENIENFLVFEEGMIIVVD